MRVLDRSFFQRDVQLSAARVHDNKNLSQIRHELSMSKDLLALRMVSPIRPDPTDSANVKKCILLRPEVNNHGMQHPNPLVSPHDAKLMLNRQEHLE